MIRNRSRMRRRETDSDHARRSRRPQWLPKRLLGVTRNAPEGVTRKLRARAEGRSWHTVEVRSRLWPRCQGPGHAGAPDAARAIARGAGTHARGGSQVGAG